MSMQEAIQHMAGHHAAHKRHVSYGKVMQVDHKRNRAKIKLMPHGNQTGFLRIANAYIGNGWTMHFPLMKDDEVIVEFPDGQLPSGIITWRLHNEVDYWIMHEKVKDDLRKCGHKDVFLLHKSGSFLRFYGQKTKSGEGHTKDGQHKENDDGDITLRARGKGCIRVEADTRLELVAPEIRVRKPHDNQSPFVLSEWVDYWNGFVRRYNGHRHLFSSGPFLGGTPVHLGERGYFPERKLTKPEVCDMHTLGVVGW